MSGGIRQAHAATAEAAAAAAAAEAEAAASEASDRAWKARGKVPYLIGKSLSLRLIT